ncbi:methyl-accepting chemotaxis protein [Pseudomonas sp. Choline-3u-10]|uniref:methyl-accepting chemotaxis protein n=1 Tax=Pseudomonadaceae TaxID=135621 RepID=UPI000535B5CD|nr:MULTISPECIES: HAMP domain-containing methyl-accepting chemotaxis protein [Pseudomonadaceae]MAL34446.1 methyl-accepting chemotaxis protein [Pseudomonas sp.]MBU0950340.1 methyl-accepting chemotaxis protein [Gammaproteobacteria bacterium]BAP79631.1 methyl-accepting chemotaxis protein [Pseudomonas sp. MT-1]KJJ65110.1 chemotaxis protein [Pseudomonas sp. 10B238]MBK3795676.1 HAMP domain-containing protein [Stutzerimonas stutzeri]
MNSTSPARQMSVQTKINLALLVVFALVLAASLFYSAGSEKQLILHVVEQQTKDTADSYFDSINTMMLTGTMGQREVLRNKILARPGVIDARIVRGEPVTKLFGPGFEHQAPKDELDRRALAGDATVEVSDGANGRVLTVINPIHAQQDYRGTNCLTCHQVPQNTVMGAVRISYDLSALDGEVHRNILTSAVIQALLLLAGLIVMGYIIRRVIISRINEMRHTMEAMTADEDLSRTVAVHAQDEVGAMGTAFNRMIFKFRNSLEAVAAVTHQLGEVSNRVSSVAEKTQTAVMEQRSETDMVASAMNEMSATVQEVARHANETASASSGADEESRVGVALATEALDGIEVLIQDIEKAAQVIKQVETDSVSIGMVLSVINGIAEQTNLLALNAAIEAARAGEQGRGFAVVADEVRTLASRTQKSTEEIQRTIEQLQNGVRNAVQAMEGAQVRAHSGSDCVAKTAQSLTVIAGEVNTINGMNTQIATAAEEQSAVAEEINRNITTISTIADTTLADASQTSQISEELVQLAAELNRLVSQFRL